MSSFPEEFIVLLSSAFIMDDFLFKWIQKFLRDFFYKTYPFSSNEFLRM